MIKIIFLTILIIIGCDMPATKYNLATAVDPNPGNIIATSDLDNKGHLQASLTNWKNTSKPDVAQESIIDNGGTHFRCATDQTISLIDPTTSLTVVDGDVYITINEDGDFFFTATAPTWSATKQGWHMTGLYTDYRAIGGCKLASGVYTDKFLYNSRDDREGANYKIETGTGVLIAALSRSSAGTTYSDIFRIKKPCSLFFEYTETGAGNAFLEFLYNGSWEENFDSSNGTPRKQSISLNPGDYRFKLINSTGTETLDAYIYACRGSQEITSPDVYEINP